jgi:hypothetical protein
MPDMCFCMTTRHDVDTMLMLNIVNTTCYTDGRRKFEIFWASLCAEGLVLKLAPVLVFEFICARGARPNAPEGECG